MMNTFYRAMFRDDDSDYGNVIIDLLLDGNRKVPARTPCFGFWGKLNSRDLKPFVLQAGRMDFGDWEDEDDRESTPFDPEERFATFEITDRIIAVGERYVIKYAGDTWFLTLERLTDVTKLD